MKKSLMLAASFMMLSVCEMFAQTDSTAVAAVPEKTETIGQILLAILIAAASLFIIGHMLYIFFKSKRFKGDFTVDHFKNVRKETGRDELATDQENGQAASLLNDAFLTWSHIETDAQGIEYRKPNKMKEILKSAEFIQQAIDIAPTDPEVVETLQQYKEVVHSNEKRRFDGSWKLITFGIIMSIIFTFMIKDSTSGGFFKTFFLNAWFFWVPIIVYYISSMTPQFLIDKRSERGTRGGCLTGGLVAMVFGVLGSGYTVRTYYSDGSTSDDNSSHIFALVLGLIIAFFVAITIIFWAFVNYLRNYVFYF